MNWSAHILSPAIMLAGREAGIIKAGPGELSNSGFKEEDGQGKEDAKDENEQRQAAPAGQGKVRKSAEKAIGNYLCGHLSMFII